MYAASWEKDRKAWDFLGSGSASGIYKSTDGGSSWERISNEGSGFPTGLDVGRIGLTVFNENTIYAVHDNQDRRDKSEENEKESDVLTKDDFKTFSDNVNGRVYKSFSEDEQQQMGSAPAVAKTPEALYQGACMACHATGVANAPKFGDKTAWEPKAALGINTLLQTAITGKGAMPPKGGSAYSEEELRSVIEYMLSEAGLAVAN